MDKVVFFDRDGVINVEKDYLHKIDDFEFIDSEFISFKHLKKFAYKFVIITNQSGIGRGYYTKEDFDKLTLWMVSEFEKRDINIEAVFCCPHGPNDGCECRKPKTGMIKESQKILDIDLDSSWLIGDKGSDIQTAINAGIKNTIQVRSGHSFDESLSKADFVIDSIKDIPKIIKQ